MRELLLAVVCGLVIALTLKIGELEEQQAYCGRIRLAQIDKIIELNKRVEKLELEDLTLRETISALRR